MYALAEHFITDQIVQFVSNLSFIAKSTVKNPYLILYLKPDRNFKWKIQVRTLKTCVMLQKYISDSQLSEVKKDSKDVKNANY